MLYEKYNLDIKNIPVYYIWDRDNKSNKSDIVKNLLLKLNNPYINDEFENGLLLLSYPAIESYTISCFEKDKVSTHENLKDYVKNNNYNIELIDINKVKRASLEMIKSLRNIGISSFNIDDIKNININVFDIEENNYKKYNEYILISFISYIFLDLGIIEFR